MPSDLAAELVGYRNEKVAAQRAGREDRVDAIDAEIGRLTAEITTRAERLESSAAALVDAGQDGNAARARADAAALREALGAPETAAESAPRERAVPKKASK